MYRWQRRKISVIFLLLSCLLHSTQSKSIENSNKPTVDPIRDNFENNIIDFDEDYSLKFNKKYGVVPWESNEKFNKDTLRYTLATDKDGNKTSLSVQNKTENSTLESFEQTTLNNDYSVIPLELISTTEDVLISLIESTTELDLTVIPLSTTQKITPAIDIKQTVTLPTSTENSESTTEYELTDKTVSENNDSETTTIKRETISDKTKKDDVAITTTEIVNITTTEKTEALVKINQTNNKSTTQKKNEKIITVESQITTNKNTNNTKIDEVSKTNSSTTIKPLHRDSSESQEDVANFSDLDASEQPDVPEDYYDSKDVLPTTAPKTDALSVIFGLAGSVVESVVESVAERVVPKSIYDLFKRMQKQNEALEAERLRSREENGGLGQFGRGILKSISSGLSKPLSQLMQGVKDIGSLDNDRGFVSSVASGVTSVATSVSDAFKDRVQAIYPGTVWCGDGHSATARSSDLGLFFFTDTCCRQHDACKIYIKSGETKYGLTNTGLFTRSHCSCDAKFRECLQKTNSLVSAQIGLTYFNVLGPQCFRKAHPIVKCVKKTRITGQKCEEYELDYTKPKMWQWFDNETF